MSSVGNEHHHGLSDAAKALLEHRARRTAQSAGATIPRCASELAPLSEWQRSIWLFGQLNPASTAYHLSQWLHLDGHLDSPALRRSIHEIFRRHTVLRSHVAVEAGQPLQQVLPMDRAELPWYDLGDLPPADRTRRLLELADICASRPFDLAAGPFARVWLVRLSNTEHVVLFTIHHIASDGWSVSLFFREMALLYNAFSAGQANPLPEPSVEYRDFAHWQHAWLRSPSAEMDVTYWQKELADAPPLLELPTDRLRPTHRDHAAAVESIVISAKLVHALRTLARDCGATLFTVMLSAFQVLLGRLSRQTDVVTGIPVAGRERAETEALVGCFMNVLPIRSRIDPHSIFRNLVSALRASMLKAYAHQQLPFGNLVERLRPERSSDYTPITQVLFNYRCDIPQPSFTFRGLNAVLENVERTSSLHALAMDVEKSEDGLCCSVLYSTGLFNGSTIARWLDYYVALLESATGNPDVPVERLSMLSAAERARLLQTAGVEPIPVDYRQCVHALIERQATHAPESVAVTLDGNKLTYRQLDRRANALAHKLKKLGIAPDMLVGVCLERSLDLVVAILAVLKAGGGYLPLDPALPKERLAYMAADSGARVLIARETMLALLHVTQTGALALDHAGFCDEIAEPPDSGAEPGNIAYVIYTSGSTGRPKGVAIEHRSLCNYVLWMQSAHPLDPADMVLSRTSIGFDLSIKELFWPMAAGACVVLAKPGSEADVAYLAALIETQRISVLMSVPTLLAALLEQAGVEKRCASLRLITCGGEAMTPPLMRRCLSRFPAASLHNAYGPTEITIGCTRWVCNGSEEATVPIGYPTANAELYVLDPELEPVPIGVPGELYVGGIGVARGYVGRPELTRERFLPNPFRPRGSDRLYRTGDLVRRRPDGALDFLGRNDDQVKVRGVRIELGEIEAALSDHPDVCTCAVSVHRGASGQPQLVGYVVSRGSTQPTTGELRRFLAGRLPEAMVPSSFVPLDALPLTSSGKVDRMRLPDPGPRTVGAEPLDAGDPLQHELIRIWEDVLQVAPIGITDNFFELGGHSLLAVSMMARVAQTFGVQPPLQALFQEPTVRCLAASIIGMNRKQEEAAGSPVWCIQPGDPDRPPLFLFHGDFNGGGLYCRKLAQRLDQSQAVYIIPPHEPGGPATVEAMASDVLPHLRSIWRGPYLLAGYCNGGLVALEVAQRLREAREPVGLLAVIDLGMANARLKMLHRAIRLSGRVLNLAPATRDRIFLRLREPMLRFLGQQPSDRSPAIRWIHLPMAALEFSLLALARRLRVSLRRLRVPEAVIPTAANQRWRRLPESDARDEALAFTGRAMQLYVPRRYRGRVAAIFSSLRLSGGSEDPVSNWRAIAADVVAYTIPGDHFSIVTERIDDLARILRKLLEDASSDGKHGPRPHQPGDTITH